jgi:signal transduction histidine kinase
LRLNADLERRVVERTHTIEQSMRDLEAFQAMVSHDLRAPLSIMRGSCALLLATGRGTLPEPMLKTVERMERAGAQMTRLVEDLLSLAHVGNKPLAREPVDMSAMCDDILAHLRKSEPQRDVDVVIRRGLACSCDPTLLRAALDNLIGNAWKYTARTPRARIEVGSIAAADGAHVFFVGDNGPGFDMKDAHRLFVPFDRLDKGADFEGTGVGLAAVHRIVERHGGRIWAEAAPGKGATFFFTL